MPLSGRTSTRSGGVKTQAEWFGEQAYAAWQEGQAVLREGQVDLARRWLERARRYAPEDPTVTLSLAAVLLQSGDAAAAALFASVTARYDLREAWLGLAATHARDGAWPDAAAALSHVLSAHVIPVQEEIAPLADRIAAAAGAAGWCCQRGDGRLQVSLSGDRRQAGLAASLDGKPLARRPGRVPRSGAFLALTHDGQPLLGSKLALGATRALDGFVASSGAGLGGWAWHPANPEADPVLLIRDAVDGRSLRLVATDTDMPSDRPLGRPRRFLVPASVLADWAGPVQVSGVDLRHLPGSPVALPGPASAAVTRCIAAGLPVGRGARRRPRLPTGWLAVPAEATGPPARAPRIPDRPLAVVVPAFRDHVLTRACLDAVRRTMPPSTRLIVVDDATPEPALAAELDGMASRGDITLLRHRTNRGFPASANAGLREAAGLPGGPDVVLLNSDALLTDGALAALRAAVHGVSDIGTATPLSNDATIMSYPDRAGGNPLPSPEELQRLGRLAARANAGVIVEVPTSVGFCMYIRRECLTEVGAFRAATFAQGYGEENDFCMRARHLGWRHVAAVGVYVGHAGGASFRQGSLGAARSALLSRNIGLLEMLHPGYLALIAAHHAADPLAPARRRLDAARWSARRARPQAGAVILITHDGGGGVERVIRRRGRDLAGEGRRAIVLRPVRDPDATSLDERSYIPGLCEVCDGAARDTPNLRFRLPAEFDALIRLLRAERPECVELHHLQGHDPALLGLAARLGIPWEAHVHDYAWFCPRITLLGPQRQFCGEPSDVTVCEACIADAGRNDEQSISVAALRARSAADLGGARRVVAPSEDAARRIRRHFPHLAPKIGQLEDDAQLPPPLAVRSGGLLRVAIVGAIGVEKGYEVLLACARDAATRHLPLEFVVIGHSIDDARLLATGRCFVTGPYREAEAVEEIHAQAPDLGFLPSIWPETWCFTLGEMWRAGLRVAAFDIGAPAGRIRSNGRGWLLPLGLPPGAVNAALLSAQASQAETFAHLIPRPSQAPLKNG